jgi:hypothetical protein
MFQLSKRDIKTAQYAYRDPEQTAQSIVNIIHTLSTYLLPESQASFRDSVRLKLAEVSAAEVSAKKMPSGARIGQAITLVKSFLNGQDEAFVSQTINRIVGKL